MKDIFSSVGVFFSPGISLQEFFPLEISLQDIFFPTQPPQNCRPLIRGGFPLSSNSVARDQLFPFT